MDGFFYYASSIRIFNHIDASVFQRSHKSNPLKRKMENNIEVISQKIPKNEIATHKHDTYIEVDHERRVNDMI